jgi:hypothetical protein
MNCKSILLLSGLALASVQLGAQSSGQNFTNSPYSNFGLGEVLNTNFAQAGFQGQTFSGAYSYSFQNPATLGGLRYTTFDVGMNGRTGTIQSNGQTRTFNGGGLSYMSLAFKTMRKNIPTYTDSAGVRKRKGARMFSWNSYLALYPSTTVGYNYTVQNDVPFKTSEAHTGKGGVNAAEYGTSIGLGKHVTLGYSAAFLFGQISDRSLFNVPDSADFYIVDDEKSVVIRGLRQQAGVMFLFGKDSSFHRIGASYRWYGATSATNQRLTQVFGIGNNSFTRPDTVINIVGDKKTISMPSGFGLGYSYTWRQKIAVGFDVYQENWSNYSAFFQQNRKFTTRRDYGVSFTLNPMDEKPRKAKKMPVPVRLGYRYSQTQNVFNNAGVEYQISENNVYAGFAIPVVRRYYDNTVLRSMIHFRFDYTTRGTLNGGLAKEQYLMATVSFNMGDIWFQRRKFD